MSQRRVFTGRHPTVFMTGNVGPVVPGQVFEVPDEHVAAFDARPDVGMPPSRRGGKKQDDVGESVSPESGDGD